MKTLNTKTLVIVFLVLFVCGCPRGGPKIVPATGVVTLKGEPLADVRIEFMKTDTGAYSFAETDGQGRFELRHAHGQPGAEPGTYRVSIFRKSKPMAVPQGQSASQDTGPGPPMTPEEPILMSDKSPIEVVITDKGPNEFNIDVK